MIITDSRASLFFLLNALRRTKTRLIFTVFIIDDDEIARAVFAEVNACFRRGVEVIMYGRNELLIGDINAGLKLLDDNIPVIEPDHGSHAKIWIVDDLVISTDRNISAEYYGPRPIFEACDLAFTSPTIADLVHAHIKNKRSTTLRASDGRYTLIFGDISNVMHNVFASHRNLRLVSCTLIPSTKLQRILIDNDHFIISSDARDKCPELFADGMETLSMLTTIPKRTRIYRGCFHYKFVLAPTFAIHGSYNLDIVSEVYCKDHIVITHNKKEIEALVNVYERLLKNTYAINKCPPLPLMFGVDRILEGILIFWQNVTSNIY